MEKLSLSDWFKEFAHTTRQNAVGTASPTPLTPLKMGGPGRSSANSLSKVFKMSSSMEFAYDTWTRLEFTRKTKSIKTSEVTITQNLIYNCYLLSRQFDLPIRVYEAIDESINGYDIEFAGETSEGYVLFPTQAKIIKNNGKYDTISHRVNK